MLEYSSESFKTSSEAFSEDPSLIGNDRKRYRRLAFNVDVLNGFVTCFFPASAKDFNVSDSPGRTPYNGLYGDVPPDRGTFFRLDVHKRVGISRVEVLKRVGKTAI